MKFNWKNFWIINICLCALIVIGAEIAAYISYNAKYMPLVIQHSKGYDNPKEFIRANKPHHQFPRKFSYKNVKDNYGFSDDVFLSKNSKKRPIITIGCSYTYGAMLNQEQTFAYKLHELTGRTSYNRGVCSTGTQFVYWQLIDKNFKKEIPDAEYVIYTFIYDHIRRNVRDLVMEYGPDIELNYEIKNGELVEKPRPFWFMYWSFLVKTYLQYSSNNRFISELSNENPLLLKTVEKSVEQTHKLYPDSKFVFLEFPEPGYCGNHSYSLDANTVKKIKDMGIIYVNAKELVGHDFCAKKYWAQDEYHPSEEAWNEVVPKLAEKLHL